MLEKIYRSLTEEPSITPLSRDVNELLKFGVEKGYLVPTPLLKVSQTARRLNVGNFKIELFSLTLGNIDSRLVPLRARIQNDHVRSEEGGLIMIGARSYQDLTSTPESTYGLAVLVDNSQIEIDLKKGSARFAEILLPTRFLTPADLRGCLIADALYDMVNAGYLTIKEGPNTPLQIQYLRKLLAEEQLPSEARLALTITFQQFESENYIRESRPSLVEVKYPYRYMQPSRD